MKETSTHIYFWGSIFSQWFKSTFTVDGTTFSSCEQWMMFNKAILFNDQESATEIIKTQDPKRQKALGRQVKNFNQKVWDEKKFDIIVQGNYYKFSQKEELKKELIRTNKILVEGSPFDRIYGVGLKWDDPRILNESQWKGENLLGKALMEVRTKLRTEIK